MAGPGVSETIHEAVLAVKLQTPLSVLADTIHAFPTVARVPGLALHPGGQGARLTKGRLTYPGNSSGWKA